MNIEEFVAESLKQIIDGIIRAQEYAKEKGAIVSPPNINYVQGKPISMAGYNLGQVIDFDTAVVATASGIRVIGGVLGASSDADNDALHVSSRIKFSIPVYYPVQGK